jgi:para-aminobenzoate synthetase
LRTLVIDNYDSYTWNLVQLLAVVNGAEPTVITNDAPLPDLADFDNVVISPGPGHPGRPGDFGICRDIVARSPIPVLGVCLGHQGIASVLGGDVVPAPRPLHGFAARIRHDGTDLFAGIPQDFRAIRYHSLHVREPLPPDLEATAFAEDGVVMGLRHRIRPLWGVQFHPESIGTEHGERLLANFRDLTPRRRPAPITTVAPVPHVDSRRFQLRVREIARPLDPELAFTALFAGSPHAFWLDGGDRSRFSHLGDGDEHLSYAVGDSHVTVTTPGGVVTERDGTILDVLARGLLERSIDKPELPFDFACGYVGYLGYEVKADCGGERAHKSAYPDAQWVFANRAVTVDRETGRTYVMALDDEEWVDRAVSTLADLPEAAPGESVAPTSDVSIVEPYLVRDRERYLADIRAARDELVAGESYEICLTNALRIPAAGDGFEAYRRLRRVNPAPFGAYLRFEGLEVACSSPERFLRIDGNGVAEAKPIKGTAPRGMTPDEDERLRASLTTSPKVYAENLMIVDLLRNDLGRICETGSVHVPRLMATETYATVHQLVSTVRGTLRAGATAIDCVRACFPGGSMTGAPKLRTMRIIDDLEEQPRGVYSGTIGFLGLDGTADLNIVIRTAVRHDGQWHVGAGGAIVLDSDPVEEYEEMLLKAAATARALLER